MKEAGTGEDKGALADRFAATGGAAQVVLVAAKIRVVANAVVLKALDKIYPLSLYKVASRFSNLLQGALKKYRI